MSSALVKYVLIAAFRDKLILALMVVFLLAASLSVFMASGAVTEKDYFAVVFGGGGMRFAGILGLVLFAVFFIRRSFETKDVEFLLSRPVSRVEFIISYAAGLSLLAVLIGLIQCLSLFIISPHLFGQGHILWCLSIIGENIIMINVALFFSMILSSAATASMAVFGFYILSRLMGQILGIIDSGKGLYDFKILEYTMQAISSVMPRLDLMGQTSWLIYGPDQGGLGIGFIVFQTLFFTILIIFASILDLKWRQF